MPGGELKFLVDEKPGYHRATTDEELDFLYKQNLEIDFEPWKRKSVQIYDLFITLDSLIKGMPQKYLFVVLIKNNKIYTMPLAPKPMKLTISRMTAIHSYLTNATASITFPDTFYLMNVWDTARCKTVATGNRLNVLTSGLTQMRRLGCLAPIFSLIKRWDFEQKQPIDMDVLLPFFNHVYGNLVFFPWQKKLDKALMRAAMQDGMDKNCTRMWIIKLQKTTPEGARLLDAGITNNLKKGFKVKLTDFVNIPDHARYKYLISADGFTASCRFGKLLGLDSAVLKETSNWIEYYYRSAEPNKHYVPFQKDTVLQTVQALEKDQAFARKVAAGGQQFAFTYLHTHAKALYVRRALTMYNELVKDMKDFMALLPNSELEGMKVHDLLRHMRTYLDSQKWFLSN